MESFTEMENSIGSVVSEILANKQKKDYYFIIQGWYRRFNYLKMKHIKTH